MAAWSRKGLRGADSAPRVPGAEADTGETVKVSPELLAALARKPAPDPTVIAAWESGELVTRPAQRLYRAQRRYEGRFTRRRYQRSPDRERSIQRRRQLAASGCMPPTMACHLTTGEQAVARIIVDEIVTHGTCTCTVDEIAARAGVCAKTAQRTLRRLGDGKQGREAIVGLRWIKVEFRPVQGRKSLPNVVTIVSDQWLTWIARGPIRSHRIGGHLRPATVNVLTKHMSSQPTERWERPQEAVRWEHEARSGP